MGDAFGATRGLLCVAVLGTALVVQGSGQEPGSGDPAAARRTAQQLRRDWVRTQITRLVPDKRSRAEILARVNRLSDDEIQELAVVCLDELEARRRQQFAALRAANARERELLARSPPAVPRGYFHPAPPLLGSPIGFFPVITWLPEGVSLSARAVVSPDGRSVRMSLAPFFSTIGPVDTFNFMTGETRRVEP